MPVLPKPKLRNFLTDSVKFHIPFACLLSFIGSVAMKYTYADSRRDTVDEFYRQEKIKREKTKDEEMALFLEGLEKLGTPGWKPQNSWR